MITAYSLHTPKITAQTWVVGTALPPDTLWLDMQDCTADEIKAVNQALRLRIPVLRHPHHVDQARQHYVEKDVLYLSTPVIIGSQSARPHIGVMIFALSPTLLVTMHEADSHALKTFASQIQANPALLSSPAVALTNLLRAFAERLADINEIIAHEMENVSHLVFQDSLQRSKAPGRGKPDSWRRVLQGLGKTARLNHRLIATLGGLDRLVTFACRAENQSRLGTAQAELITLQRDLTALQEQANAMVNEATFLLDAIVGAISIEQNNVIKIFSMVAVILMPPTMIASIYGMNFAHMPELATVWGYPVALVLMAISGFLPWYWFKRKGWF